MMEIDSFDMTSSSASLSRGHTGISAGYFYKRQIAEKCATSSIYFFLVKTRQGGCTASRRHLFDLWNQIHPRPAYGQRWITLFTLAALACIALRKFLYDPATAMVLLVCSLAASPA
jgi:hypothetical protein